MFSKPVFLDTIPIDSGLLILALIVIIFLILFFSVSLYNLKSSSTKNEGIIREKDLKIESIENNMKGQAQDYGQSLFTKWKENELEEHRKVIYNACYQESLTKLAQWKIDNEKSIREDAKKRSTSILMGQLTEHLVPFSEYFKNFNFKDARFMGNPIDLIVFDGVEEKKDIITIHFVEIKTGVSALSKKQIQIRDAVKAKRVEWHLISLGNFNGALLDGIAPIS